MVVSLHIGEFRGLSVLTKSLTVPAERWELAESKGMVLGKVMGTSKRERTSGASFGRWALFCSWESEEAFENFKDSSPVLARWEKYSKSLVQYTMQPLWSKGAWNGVLPFGDLETRKQDAETPGVVAVLTRASVRWNKTYAFQKVSGRADVQWQNNPACHLALGMGEWPIGQLATFSIWESVEAMKDFAYKTPEHTDVMRKAKQDGWFREELFARLRVIETKQLK